MVWFWKKKGEQETRNEFSDLPPLPPMPEDSETGGFPQLDAQDDGQQQSLPPLPPLPELPPLQRAQAYPSQTQLQMSAQQLPYPLSPPMQQSSQPTYEQAGATVFVRLDKYKDIMRTIENLQLKLDDLQRSLSKISSIKQKESEIMQGWGALMTESREKIDQLNQKLLKPGET